MRGSLRSKRVNDEEGFGVGEEGNEGEDEELLLSRGLFVNQFPVAGS